MDYILKKTCIQELLPLLFEFNVLDGNNIYNLSMAPPTHAGFNHGGHDFYVTFLPYPLTDAD